MIFSQVLCQEQKWKFDNRYQDKLLFLHSFVNYEFNPDWNFLWEESQFQSTSTRMSFGSVEVNDLLCNAQVKINSELVPGFRFLLDYQQYASQHQDQETVSAFLGFEKSIFRNFSAYFLATPAFHKEEVDTRLGLSLDNSERTQYLRLAFCWDDFVYDSKNNLAGGTSQQPYGLCWYTRAGKDKLWFYSEGKYSQGFNRHYPDPAKSPDMMNHEQKIGNSLTKVYYKISQKSLVELSFIHYMYDEMKRFRMGGFSDFRYDNAIYLSAFKYLMPVSQNQRLRLIGRYVIQESNASGFKNYNYSRNEFLPAIFYEYWFTNFIWEFGYKGAVIDWDFDDLSPQNDYSFDGYTEKLKFGCTYKINDSAFLQLSISHVLSYWGFGGGNLQFIARL